MRRSPTAGAVAAAALLTAIAGSPSSAATAGSAPSRLPSSTTPAAVPAPAPAPAAVAPASGALDLMTYNVAGLPEIVNSAPLPRAPKTRLIGQRLAPYEVVHVQEDFNFHDDLYAGDTTHFFRTVTSGLATIGSGLNTLSTVPYDADDLERVQWTACTFDTGDCLTPKGFTFVRLRLAEGVYVDLYNLHANAGTTAENEAARASNLAQLTAFIRSRSKGNAVVVMGDTNTRYTRAEDTVAAFTRANGLTDAWVQLERGGVPPVAGSPALVCPEVAPPDSCEVVDKVLYRSNRAVALAATSFTNADAGFRDGGLPLSDHFPIAVAMSWRQKAAFRMTDQYGGAAGGFFTDLPGLTGTSKAASVSLRTSGGRVAQVSVRLATGAVLAHGPAVGAARTLTLRAGEALTGAIVCRSVVGGVARMSSLTLTTNQARSVAGGTTSADCFTSTAPAGWSIAGFHGRAGDAVDKLGLVLTRL